ncbi:unnamed protein product [Vitrella brassicaformis CCMP3155]|uniref:Uncharacterized protein n=2 Tax=Vitrella brassicaformis TaxID=1169539 RepID=A0A0G4E8T8_VITBC|nr:unnamed protein product [Vitrella brassicaformis CCMP3155]|eukprot:CEL91814.1 unnamed protein product [Vitrella brassicaformis CCMP3155]
MDEDYVPEDESAGGEEMEDEYQPEFDEEDYVPKRPSSRKRAAAIPPKKGRASKARKQGAIPPLIEVNVTQGAAAARGNEAPEVAAAAPEAVKKLAKRMRSSDVPEVQKLASVIVAHQLDADTLMQVLVENRDVQTMREQWGMRAGPAIQLYMFLTPDRRGSGDIEAVERSKKVPLAELSADKVHAKLMDAGKKYKKLQEIAPTLLEEEVSGQALDEILDLHKASYADYLWIDGLLREWPGGSMQLKLGWKVAMCKGLRDKGVEPRATLGSMTVE